MRAPPSNWSGTGFWGLAARAKKLARCHAPTTTSRMTGNATRSFIRVMLGLRNYQIELIVDFDRLTGAGAGSALLTAPMGFGKTVIAAGIVASAFAVGQRVLLGEKAA